MISAYLVDTTITAQQQNSMKTCVFLHNAVLINRINVFRVLKRKSYAKKLYGTS